MDMSYTSEEMKINNFYKYRSLSLNDGSYENTEKMLKNGEIFFPNPTMFNDPFDCSINETVCSTDKEFNDSLKRYKFNDSDILTIITKRNSGNLDFSKILEKNYKDSFRVYCLSRNYNNILMWSHYADEHKGICIGLKTTIFGNSLTLKCEDGFLDRKITNGNNYLPIFRVDYNDDKPEPYNLIKMNKENIKPFFFRKSKCWSYEEEYRIVLYNNSIIKNPVVVNLNEISEVYLGLRIEKEQKDRIINIINNLHNIHIFQMIEVEGKYQIKPEAIN